MSLPIRSMIRTSSAGDRQPGEVAVGLVPELALPGVHRGGGDRLDPPEPRVAVLDERQPERDRRRRARVNAATAGISSAKVVEALAVERVGALLLAKPDRDHLQQAALDRAAEVGVRLDPVDRDDRRRPRRGHAGR